MFRTACTWMFKLPKAAGKACSAQDGGVNWAFFRLALGQFKRYHCLSQHALKTSAVICLRGTNFVPLLISFTISVLFTSDLISVVSCVSTFAIGAGLEAFVGICIQGIKGVAAKCSSIFNQSV